MLDVLEEGDGEVGGVVGSQNELLQSGSLEHAHTGVSLVLDDQLHRLLVVAGSSLHRHSGLEGDGRLLHFAGLLLLELFLELGDAVVLLGGAVHEVVDVAHGLVEQVRGLVVLLPVGKGLVSETLGCVPRERSLSLREGLVVLLHAPVDRQEPTVLSVRHQYWISFPRKHRVELARFRDVHADGLEERVGFKVLQIHDEPAAELLLEAVVTSQVYLCRVSNVTCRIGVEVELAFLLQDVLLVRHGVLALGLRPTLEVVSCSPHRCSIRAVGR